LRGESAVLDVGFASPPSEGKKKEGATISPRRARNVREGGEGKGGLFFSCRPEGERNLPLASVRGGGSPAFFPCGRKKKGRFLTSPSYY